MSKHPGTWLVIALFGAGHAAAQAEVTRTGKTFAVTLHHGTLSTELAARLADEALGAAERTRPVLEKLYQRPAKPPTIHLYTDAGQHALIAKEPTWGFVRTGVCRPEKTESYVLLRPLLTEQEFEMVGLPESTQHEIITQAAQLAACDRSELARKHPWCAEVFAAGVLDAVAFADAKEGVDPNHDSRLWYLVREAKEGRTPALRKLVAHVGGVGTPAEHAYVQAGQAATARLFAGTGSAWAKKLLNAKVKEQGRVVDERYEVIEAVLGDDWKRSDERLAKLLASCAPAWWVGPPLVALREGRFLLAAGDEAAALGSGPRTPPVPYVIRGTAELVPSRDNRLLLRLDQKETTMLVCEFTAKWVSVARLTRGEDAKPVWRKANAPIELGKPFAFVVEVTATLRITIDGAQVADLPLEGSVLDGDWSFSKDRGIAWLSEVRCESLLPPKKK